MTYQIRQIQIASSKIINELKSLIDQAFSFNYNLDTNNQPLANRTEFMSKNELSNMIKKGEMFELIDFDVKNEFLMVKTSHKIIGCVSLTLDYESKTLHIGLLAIHENYRNKGLGKQIMNFAENMAKTDDSINFIELVIFYHKDCSATKLSYGMYERLGYEPYKMSTLCNSEYLKERLEHVLREKKEFRNFEPDHAIKAIFKYDYEIKFMKKII